MPGKVQRTSCKLYNTPLEEKAMQQFEYQCAFVSL